MKPNEIWLSPHLQLDFSFKADFRNQHHAHSAQFCLPEIFESLSAPGRELQMCKERLQSVQQFLLEELKIDIVEDGLFIFCFGAMHKCTRL